MATHHHLTAQVSLNVKRKSDGKMAEFILPETTTILELKNDLKHRLTPQYPQSCRLIFRDEVLKGKHTLKHYGIKVGVDGQDILMDDSKEWRSASSSSEEDTGLHHQPADQVSLNVKRKSDGKMIEFIVPETTTILELKNDLKHRLTPQYVGACRLMFRGEILKGKHTLKYYGIKVGVDGQDILMDDSKEWLSSSDSEADEIL